MADDLRIRTMQPSDLPLLERLCGDAGWNQTRADLRNFLKLADDVAFVASWAGVDAGTVCTFVFGSTAWIALMLVDEPLRGRGIGTALMRHALAYLEARRIERVRLDATPLGRPVYERLGFVAEYEVLRYGGVPPRVDEPLSTPEIVGVGPGRLAAVRRLDADVTRADRSAVVDSLYRKRGRFRALEFDGLMAGYIAFRPGRNAFQIGPCLALDSRGGLLFDWAFNQTQVSPVFVDIPADNRQPRDVAESAGLNVQRTLTRMCRGPRPGEKVEMIWASSGPEKG
jgi:GNAT superfamily N-acetyltransferase